MAQVTPQPNSSRSSADEATTLLAPEAAEAGAALKTAGGAVAGAAADVASGKIDVKLEISNSKDRCQEYFQQFQDAPPNGKATLALGLCVKYLLVPLLYVAKVYFWFARILYKLYKFLPLNVLSMIFGIGLCFFGGTYFATIAAIEAFRQFGGELLYQELEVLFREGLLATAAIEVAAKEDLDANGIADFDEMDFHTRTKASAFVAMKAVTDPMAVQKACTFVCTTYLSVLAVLKFQFAKTVTLCMAMAEMLELPCCRIFGPIVAAVLGPDLNKWAYASVSVTIKIVAVILATWVQAVISSFYSALRGGKLFAEGFINLLSKYGVMDKCTCVTQKDGKFDPDASYLDEIIAYPLAAAGFYWQIKNNFLLPFPWSLVLLPISIVEWFLKWQIFT